MQSRERFDVRVRGRLKIIEYQTTEDYEAKRNEKVLVDQTNDIHRENMGIIIARALADRPDHSIYWMYFGNGGATIDPLGNVVRNPPNVIGTADLYSPTYFENVDDRLSAPAGNYIAIAHVTGTRVSNVVVHCVLGKNEPDFDQPFVFNEVGLKSQDGLLLTHLTFTPVSKAPSRVIEVIYTLVVEVGAADNEVIRFTGVHVTASVGGFPQIQTRPMFAGLDATSHFGVMTPQAVSVTEVCLNGVLVDDNNDFSFPNWACADFSIPTTNCGMAIIWSRDMVSFDTFDNDGAGLYLDNFSQLRLFDIAGAPILEVDLFELAPFTDTDDQLTNDIVSWDTATQQVQWMRDGNLIDLTGIVTWSSTNPVGYPPGDVFIFNPYTNTQYDPGYGTLFMVWYDHFNSFFDLTDSNNIARIRSNTGQIIDPGTNGQNVTGTTPALFMTGLAADFVNLGTGGTFTNTDSGGLFDAPTTSCDVVPAPPKGIAFTQQPGPTVYDEPI